MSFIGAVARKFPSFVTAARNLEKTGRSTEQIASDISMLRLEYWWRSITGYGETIAAAKPQAAVVGQKIMNPGELTYRELAIGAVGGAQILGMFTIGEMVGRKSIIGYNEGKDSMGHH